MHSYFLAVACSNYLNKSFCIRPCIHICVSHVPILSGEQRRSPKNTKKGNREPQQKYTIQPKSEYMNQKQNRNCSCYKREDN